MQGLNKTNYEISPNGIARPKSVAPENAKKILAKERTKLPNKLSLLQSKNF